MPHTSQVTSFSAPLNDAIGPLLPYITTPPIKTKGAILGPRLIGPGEPFCWDTQGYMRDGYTTRPTVRIYGDVGSGKSLLAKVISYEFGAVSNRGIRTRVYADNHRRLDGIDEYERLGRLFGGKTMNLDEKINLFDPTVGLTASDHLESLVSIYEATNDRQAPSAQKKLAMRVALHEMFEPEAMRTNAPSAERLAKILLNLRKENAIDHIKRVIQTVRAADDREADAEVKALKQLDVSSEDVQELQELDQSLSVEEYDTGNIDWDRFGRDAGDVAQAILDFLDGEFGETFGGTSSLADKLGGGFAGINYAHKNDATVAAVTSHILRIKRRAEINRDFRFIYGIENMDENSGLWEIPDFGRTTRKRLKFARGEDTTIIQIAQSPRDYSSVGEPESQVRKNAMNSEKDIGIHIYAHIDDPDTVAEIRNDRGLSPFEAKMIQNLGRGQYGVKFPNHPTMEFFELYRTPFRKWLGETNSALYNALQRAS